MADTIRIKEDITLKAQANLGEEVSDIDFSAGSEMSVLQEWEKAWLVKDDEGRLFNVKKEWAEEA